MKFQTARIGRRETGRLKHFDDGDLNALGCRFSLRDKGKAVCGEGGCQWEGEGKNGAWVLRLACI